MKPSIVKEKSKFSNDEIELIIDALQEEECPDLPRETIREVVEEHLPKSAPPSTSGVLLSIVNDYIKKTGDTSALLPYVTNIRGKPFSLNNHRMFQPLFNLYTHAQEFTYMCSRQVGKTESMNAFIGLRAALIPHYSVLVVAPRYAQAKMIVKDKMFPFMKESFEAKIPGQLISSMKDCSALEVKTILNNSITYIGCYQDPDGARGQSKDVVAYDEAQDINPIFIEVVNSVTDGSLYYGNKYFFGTAKGTSNLLTTKFNEGSQGFLAIECPDCGYVNWATNDEDPDNEGRFLCERMIRPTGPHCIKCDHPFELMYVLHNVEIKHRFPERLKRRELENGTILPAKISICVNQILHPAHIGSRDKAAALYNAMDGGMDRATFVNEKLGFPYDRGDVLITPAELYRNCSEDKNDNNTLKYARQVSRAGKYDRYLSVDWGGYGDEGAHSYTAITFFIKDRGSVDNFRVLFMERLDKSTTPEMAADRVATLTLTLGPDFVVHDQAGAGFLAEVLLRQRNVKNIIGVVYDGNSRRAQTMESTDADKQRNGEKLLKARSLELFYCLIKSGYVKFPYKTDKVEELMSDFLNMERKTRQSDERSDTYLIGKKEGVPDDMAHALNFGICVAVKKDGAFPTLYRQHLGNTLL